MNVFDYIKIITGKKSLQYETYASYDENYSLWNLGICLGEIYSPVNLYFSDSKVNRNDSEKVKNAVLRFKFNYNKIKVYSKVLNDSNTLIDKCISDLITHVENKKSNLPPIYISIDNLKKSIIHDIKTFSTHLTNVFLFGFQLEKLHVILLQQPFKEREIKMDINELLTIITSIEKGDKRLESPNLEISTVNLKILKTLLKLLKRKLKKILERSGNKYNEYEKLINEIFFKMLTDIILDIKNPIQFVKAKFLLFILYYYLAVFIIIGISKLGENILSGILANSFPEMNYTIKLIISFLPLLFYIFVLIFRRLNHFLINWFIWGTMSRQINKFCRAKC